MLQHTSLVRSTVKIYDSSTYYAIYTEYFLNFFHWQMGFVQGKKQSGFNFDNVPSYNISLLLSVEFQSQGGNGIGDIQDQKSLKVPGVLYL